jgi:hypothetical protein
MLAYIQKNPVAGLVVGALVIIGTGIQSTGIEIVDRLGYWVAQGGFTLLSFYVLLRALGYNQLKQFKRGMPEQQPPLEEEFIEFEELESRPKNAPPVVENPTEPPQTTEQEPPESDKPFDQLFR